jgi:hypothetical protein
MQRDVWIIGGGTLAVGAIIWLFAGNPENVSRIHDQRMHVDQGLHAAPELKLVSERSPYMRNER